MTTDQQQDIDRVLALVARHARHFARDPLDAEDLAQDVLLKVGRGWKREYAYWNDAQLAMWLCVITKRTWIEGLRKAQRTVQTVEMSENIFAGEDVESDVERRELIDTALSHLPAKQRALLLLRAQGYTNVEMGKRVGATRENVKKHLYRARLAFREEWERVAA